MRLRRDERSTSGQEYLFPAPLRLISSPFTVAETKLTHVPLSFNGLTTRPLRADNAELKIYHGGSHGLCTTEKKVNEDLLAFIKG